MNAVQGKLIIEHNPKGEFRIRKWTVPSNRQAVGWTPAAEYTYTGSESVKWYGLKLPSGVTLEGAADTQEAVNLYLDDLAGRLLTAADVFGALHDFERVFELTVTSDEQ